MIIGIFFYKRTHPYTMSCGREKECGSYEIKLARPCVDDPGKYIAESQYRREFSMEDLCTILQNKKERGVVDDLKCSARLGVAKFEFEEKTVMLYRSGRIDIRKTTDVEDAKILMEKVEEMVKKAFSDTSCD